MVNIKTGSSNAKCNNGKLELNNKNFDPTSSLKNQQKFFNKEIKSKEKKKTNYYVCFKLNKNINYQPVNQISSKEEEEEEEK